MFTPTTNLKMVGSGSKHVVVRPCWTTIPTYCPVHWAEQSHAWCEIVLVDLHSYNSGEIFSNRPGELNFKYLVISGVELCIHLCLLPTTEPLKLAPFLSYMHLGFFSELFNCMKCAEVRIIFVVIIMTTLSIFCSPPEVTCIINSALKKRPIVLFLCVCLSPLRYVSV